MLASLKLTAFGERGINFAMLCCRIDAPNPTLAKGDWLLRRRCLLRYAFPLTSPVGPLQRTALSKKLINQLFLFLATMSANKFAPYYPKTKGVENSTPFCFVCSLWELRDLKVEPLGSSSRGYHIGVGCKPSHKHNSILATPTLSKQCHTRRNDFDREPLARGFCWGVFGGLHTKTHPQQKKRLIKISRWSKS